MRITFVLAGGFAHTGGDRVIATFARELHARGHTVRLVAPPRRAPTWQQRLKRFKQARRGYPPVRASHYSDLADLRLTLERHRPVTAADVPDADVVLATWWETAEWVAGFPPAKGVKAYFIQHHEVFDYLPQARAAATYRLPLHKIVISEWLKQLMQETYADPETSRVHPGVDRNLFDAPPRERRRAPTAGFVYSVTPWKGAAVLGKAVQLARQDIPDLRVRAFGQDAPRADVPLPPGCEYAYAPAQADIRKVYAGCDVWLAGSWSEGFCLPALEAMACRCPVAATRVGALPELVSEGINGYLVEPGDAAALAERLGRVLQLDPAAWRAMSDAAYQTAQPYSWQNAADEMEQVLQALAARGSGTPRMQAPSLNKAQGTVTVKRGAQINA